MSIADNIIVEFDKGEGGPLQEPIRSKIMVALKNWETVITPEFLDHPTDNFKSVARFFQNAIGVENNADIKKDGKLLGCKSFSFSDTEKWRSDEKSEREIERKYTLENNNNRFIEFSPLKISARSWEEFQKNPETVRDAIELLETYINGVFLKEKIDTMNLQHTGNDSVVSNNNDAINRAHKNIFLPSTDDADDLDRDDGQKKNYFKKAIKKRIQELYNIYMEGKVNDVMRGFQKTLPRDAQEVFRNKPNDASVINYNRFMGFKGGERNPDVGMCLRDVNTYYPWALDFMGDLDAKMAANVIEEKGKIPENIIGTEKGSVLIKAIIRKNIEVSIKQEFNLGEDYKKIVDFIEICNSIDSPGLESLRDMTKKMRQDSDVLSLFIDIAQNLSDEISTFVCEQRGNKNINDIMNPERVLVFNNFRKLKENLISMGVPEYSIKLPSSLSDLNKFYLNKTLQNRMQNDISVPSLSMFAHDAMKNAVFIAMGKERRSMTTGNVFRALYGNNIDLPIVLNSVIKNGDNRLNERAINIEGKLVSSSDIFTMEDVADVPLPRVGNLKNHYSFNKDDDYIIEFPETIRDFYKSMETEYVSEDSGDKIRLGVNGDLKKLLPVLGQRVISQNTFFLVPDNYSLKKSFLIKQRAAGDIGHRTVAYVELSVDKMISSMSDIKPSFAVVDKTMASPSAVELAVKHLAQQSNIRIDKEATRKMCLENINEIKDNIPNRGILIPDYIDQGITQRSIYQWFKNNNMLPIEELNADDTNLERNVKKFMEVTFTPIRKRAIDIINNDPNNKIQNEPEEINNDNDMGM